MVELFFCVSITDKFIICSLTLKSVYEIVIAPKFLNTLFFIEQPLALDLSFKAPNITGEDQKITSKNVEENYIRMYSAGAQPQDWDLKMMKVKTMWNVKQEH